MTSQRIMAAIRNTCVNVIVMRTVSRHRKSYINNRHCCRNFGSSNFISKGTCKTVFAQDELNVGKQKLVYRVAALRWGLGRRKCHHHESPNPGVCQ